MRCKTCIIHSLRRNTIKAQKHCGQFVAAAAAAAQHHAAHYCRNKTVESVFVWNMVHQRGYQGVRIKIKSLIAAIETES
jgi:hypothetical protein